MSLGIDIDLASHVLLADGWYSVVDHSFTLDSYEYYSYHRNDPNDPNVTMCCTTAGAPASALLGSRSR